ncbi:hypothetical protein EU527_13885 [Candidatus Thorarchaeota archaeon]|nr:MAG: hypothetical protein EU527_13885 [Candidatus Thorarchaeota archaeon]
MDHALALSKRAKMTEVIRVYSTFVEYNIAKTTFIYTSLTHIWSIAWAIWPKEKKKMSEEYGVKTIVQYMSAIALALFYLIYMPWTYLSAAMLAQPMWLWVYYFTLVIGLLFPMYYAIGKENMAWFCLGLAIIINSVIWLVVPLGTITYEAIAAVLVLIVGVLFFIGPFLENKMGNWDFMKNIFHFLKGLLLILAIYFYADFNIDAMIGPGSANHIMPQFIYMGGALMIAFAVCLMIYGLFNIFKMKLGEKIGGYFGDLAKIFYMLMVLIFLLGILYNGTAYALTSPWGYVLGTSASIDFFAGLWAFGNSNLGAILLIILFIYGMGKIAKKFEQ